MTGAIMKLSATDIAFEGFRLVRDRPMALLAWAVLQFLGTLATDPGVLILRNAYDKMGKLGVNPMATSLPTPAQAAVVSSLTGDLLQGSGIVFGVLILVSAVLDPGVYRVALAPSERGFFSLKLGLQEVRQALVMVVLSAVFTGLYMCGFMGSLLFAGVFAVAGPSASVLGFAVGVTVTLCALVYFATRLSLAGPLTFQQNRVDVFGSWALTRGHFYGLFGGYLLAVIMAVLVYILSLTIFQALVAVLAAAVDATGGKSDTLLTTPKTVGALYSPIELFGDAYFAVVGALGAAILVGARAAAFIQIRKQQPA